MNLLKEYLLVACLALISIVQAQEDTTLLTVDEAVRYALEHNKKLLNSKDDISIAQQQFKEARAPGLPQVEGSLDYMTYFGYESELDFGGSDGGNSGEVPADPQTQAILQAISQMMGPSTIKMGDQSNVKLQVSQVLFSAQLWVGMKMAKLGKQMTELSYELTELDVKEQVINSYYLNIMTDNMVGTLDESLASMKDLLKHTDNMYKMGVAEQTDVDQLRVSLSQLENSKKQMERNIILNKNMFRIVTGLDTKTNFVLTDSLENLIKGVEETLSLNDTLNLQENPTFQLLTMQEKLGQKQVKLKQSAYTPVLVGFYNFTGKLLATDFDLNPPHVAGVTLSIPIYSGGAKRAQVVQEKIKLDQVKRNKALVEDQLALQDKQLLFELQNAYDNYVTQKENIDVAKRVYKSYENKYKQGVASSLDLTQASTNLIQAESNYIQAAVALLTAKLELDKLHNNI